jgi:hypothetical protein
MVACAIWPQLIPSATLAQNVEPTQIELGVLKCLVENAGWLEQLPDDPVEFFGDLCPVDEGNESVDSSVRIDTPDVTTKPESSAPPILRVAVRKAALKCLVEFGGKISEQSVDLSWDQGVVTGMTFGQTRLDLTKCVTSMKETSQSPTP